ncbi:MAG: DMT family transporter [Alphaproteobacteria bacterium]|jgi:drug/metabolite transporter (DMT)-like permease|nr:DMT family transporter [Alphaproteobacteria bacterium]
MTNSYSLGISLGLLSTFFYSIMDATIKYASIHHKIDFVVFYFYISTLIVIFILIIGLYKFKTDLFIVKNPLAVLIRGFITFINFFLVFYILKYLPLDIYYSIVFTAPLIASIMAVFFLKEKFTLFKSISLFLGFLGVLIIANPFSNNFEEKYLVPMLITVLIALFVALSGLVTRKYLYNENSIKISFYVFLICSVCSGLVSVGKTGFSGFIIDNSLLNYVLLTAVTCLIGFFLFLKAYQITPIQLVAPTEYALMIWGVFFGYIIFGDSTTLTTVLGCFIVIISNIIITIDSKREKANVQ